MRSEILKAAVQAAHEAEAQAVEKAKVRYRGVTMSRAQRRQVAMEGAKAIEGPGNWARVGTGRGGFYIGGAQLGRKPNNLLSPAKRKK